MLTPIAVVALCGVAGGFLLGRSDLLLRRRETWARARDLLDAARDNDLDGFNDINPLEPYGTHPADTRLVDVNELAGPSRGSRVRWYFGWWWRAAVSCSVCAGWWAAAVTVVVWGSLARAAETEVPFAWAEAPVVWGAACALHTLVASSANRWEVW